MDPEEELEAVEEAWEEVDETDALGERELRDRAGKTIGAVHWRPGNFWLALTVGGKPLGFGYDWLTFSNLCGLVAPELDALIREQAPEAGPVLDRYPLGPTAVSREVRDEVEVTVDQRFSYRQYLSWMLDRPDRGLEDCELFRVPWSPGGAWHAGGFGELIRNQNIETIAVRVRLAVRPFPGAQVHLVRREGSPQGTRLLGHWYRPADSAEEPEEPRWEVDDHLALCFGRIPDELYLSVSPGASASS